MNHDHFSISSCSRTLAYIQYYTCKYLPGRHFYAEHLRRLAGWLHQPDPTLRTARAHPQLAAHLVLLHSSGLLTYETGVWQPAATVYGWLSATPHMQLDALLVAMDDGRWQASIDALRLSAALPFDYQAFVRQTLQRQRDRPMAAATANARLTVVPDGWRLYLPAALTAQQQFELLQLGDWEPAPNGWLGGMVVITPATMMRHFQRGGSPHHVEQQLAAVLPHPLGAAERENLLAWYQAAARYRVRQVWLLETPQAKQLAEIEQNGRLRRGIQERLGPRTAVIRPSFVPPLQKWLHKRGEIAAVPTDIPLAANQSNAAYSWLGLAVLTELHHLLPLKAPTPHHALVTIGDQLTPPEQAELTAVAADIVNQVRQAIRGHDAFFPQRDAVPDGWLTLIEQTMTAGGCVEMQYQALGERTPSWRRVEPYSLTQRSGLTYLQGYCHRAEAVLTFRLDRALALERVPPA